MINFLQEGLGCDDVRRTKRDFCKCVKEGYEPFVKMWCTWYDQMIKTSLRATDLPAHLRAMDSIRCSLTMPAEATKHLPLEPFKIFSCKSSSSNLVPCEDLMAPEQVFASS
jgi:hypothetical protein